MELDWRWIFTSLLIGTVVMYSLVRRVNEWIYVSTLDSDLRNTLPPGDLGWPLIGNMMSLLRAFKYGDPNSFIPQISNKYGRAPIYRAMLFGKPGVVVTTAEACRKILLDEGFGHGQEAISFFLGYINTVAETSFRELAKLDKPIEFLTEMKITSFKSLMKVFASKEIDQQLLGYMEREYKLVSNGFFAIPINLPGFTYHKSLKAKNNLLKIFKEIVYKRRNGLSNNDLDAKKDLLDLIIEASDDRGNKYNDEEIACFLLTLLFAGQESTSLTLTWAIIFLEENPQFLQKAKEEQEDILKRRKSLEIGLTLSEIKHMKFLQKVIDETLRLTSIIFAIHREAKTNITLYGYTIPKGWKVYPWLRNVHSDPENYENPKDFNPLRWDEHRTKMSAFLPFGAGSGLCPGADMAKLQLSIYLHYFLLNYRLERINPKTKAEYFPLMKPTDRCLARVKKVS